MLKQNPNDYIRDSLAISKDNCTNILMTSFTHLIKYFELVAEKGKLNQEIYVQGQYFRFKLISMTASFHFFPNVYKADMNASC